MIAQAALLLTDIVDSTQTTQRLGDEPAASLWSEHDRRSRSLLRQHHGREIDRSDGFLLLFDTAADAARYALSYHAQMAEMGLAARAGLHVGPVLLLEASDDDVALGAKRIQIEGPGAACGSAGDGDGARRPDVAHRSGCAGAGICEHRRRGAGSYPWPLPAEGSERSGRDLRDRHRRAVQLHAARRCGQVLPRHPGRRSLAAGTRCAAPLAGGARPVHRPRRRPCADRTSVRIRYPAAHAARTWWHGQDASCDSIWPRLARRLARGRLVLRPFRRIVARRHLLRDQPRAGRAPWRRRCGRAT